MFTFTSAFMVISLKKTTSLTVKLPAHLQVSLFSQLLSAPPDWLELLELLSVMASCWCCSGSSSRAFLRQMAANSILATGMAAD